MHKPCKGGEIYHISILQRTVIAFSSEWRHELNLKEVGKMGYYIQIRCSTLAGQGENLMFFGDDFRWWIMTRGNMSFSCKTKPFSGGAQGCRSPGADALLGAFVSSCLVPRREIPWRRTIGMAPKKTNRQPPTKLVIHKLVAYYVV